MEVDSVIDFDPLADAFNDDQSFRTLLKNRTFNDYLNTFLSLPVFAVRILYRRDNGVFELEQPVSRTAHHLINENILTWVRVNRGSMFLKTSICNEYRFCATLLDLRVCLSVDEYDEDDLLKFQSKYMAKVIDMQRLKGYMQGSIGESMILFWLDSERFRRQVPKNCRRFVLKEIYSKYLIDGAIHELSYSVRENIKSHLKCLWEERDRRGSRTFIHSAVLLTAQDIVLQSLQDYWIPKYVQHRLKRRNLIKKRWAKALSIPQKIKKVKKKKAMLATLVDEIKKQTDELNKKRKELEAANKTEDSHNDSHRASVTNDEKFPRKRRHSTSVDTRPSRRDAQWRNTSIAAEVGTSLLSSKEHPPTTTDDVKFSRIRSQSTSLDATPSQKDALCQKNSVAVGTKSSSHSRERMSISHRRDRTMSENRADINTDEDSEDYVPMYLRVFHQKELNEDEEEEEDCLISEISNSKLITIETPSITEMDCAENKDHTLFPPLNPSIVAQDQKKKKRATFFESVHEDSEEYEADNEDNIMGDDAKRTHLPLIKTLENASKSFISTMIHLPRCPSKVQQPYSRSFVKENKLSVVPDEDHQYTCLVAALTTDEAAGKPLLQYFKETGNKTAECNLKFWAASNDILTDCRCIDPLVRQKQYHTLIYLHLSDFSGSLVSLPQSVKEELCTLLPKDVGVTKLIEATNNVAVKLLPEWDEFMKYDKKIFLKSTTKIKRKMTMTSTLGTDSMLPSLVKDDMLAMNEDDDEFDGTFPDSLDPIQQRDTDARAMNCRRMWRAMELAISICKPKHIEMLADANENEKWTTDESDNENSDDNPARRDERVAGSLALKSLEYLNQKAERLKKLEELFNKRHQSLAHEYGGVNLLKDVEHADFEPDGDEYKPFLERARRKTENTVKPPRPRCFQDVLTDPIQYEHFKRFLTKEKEDTPLLFWSAVESMRTTSRSAKARQGRTHGIVKRYFGSAAMHGKDLKCNADIIKEIPYMEKVTPAMLVSAQACVSKTLEETWFAKYLLTFQDCGGVTGVTLLPIYGVSAANSEITRSVKQKTRGLWRMFTRNVISFRRGIMAQETLKGFTKFLELQHQLNLEQAVANNQIDQGVPPRIVVNNKLIHTEKLANDLCFWSEVGRYKDFADAVVLCAKLGNYTKDDELIVVKKAKTIVDCFLDSQIPPRVQLNISNDLAENVIQLVQNGIIERGLFHEAALSTFSTLIFFWKKYCLHRFLPIEQLPVVKKQIKVDRSLQIIAKQKALKTNRIKKVTLSVDEDCTKLMFSLQLGLRLGMPKALIKRRTAASECGDSTSIIITGDDSTLHNPTFTVPQI